MMNLHKFVMRIKVPSDSTLFASSTCMLLVHDKHLHSVGLKAMATVIFRNCNGSFKECAHTVHCSQVLHLTKCVSNPLYVHVHK